MTPDPRAARAEALLREVGIVARVEALGPEGEIAALSVPADAWERVASGTVAGVTERVRAVGFRYVAVDLDPGPAPGDP